MKDLRKIVALIGLIVTGCQTTETSPLPDSTGKVGDLLGERAGVHRINGQLVCYYDVINPKSGRTFSATPPPEVKHCPDHVIKNAYTNHVEWGKVRP